MRKSRRGMLLAEMLVSLAIAAALLTAVGVALDASIKAYKVNQEQVTLMQRGRLGLHRLLTQVRNSALHTPAHYDAASDRIVVDATASGQFQGGAVCAGLPGVGLRIIDGGVSHDYWYAWDASKRRLLAQKDNQAPRVMLSGVSAFELTMEPMRSAEAIKSGGGFDLLLRATINLTVAETLASAESGGQGTLQDSTGKQQLSFSGSVLPRKNVWSGQRLSVSIAEERRLGL